MLQTNLDRLFLKTEPVRGNNTYVRGTLLCQNSTHCYGSHSADRNTPLSHFVVRSVERGWLNTRLWFQAG
jgi:hypothetical protein